MSTGASSEKLDEVSRTVQMPMDGTVFDSDPEGLIKGEKEDGLQVDDKVARSNDAAVVNGPAAAEEEKGAVGASERFRTMRTILGILAWTPPNCRYDPNHPPKFTLAMNALFGFAGTATVANLYYCQPILNKISEDFDVSFEKGSSVATLMQAGYAAGLLFICPLGDLFPRRPFILALIALTASIWIGLCLTKSFNAFAAISFICGVTTVTPQLMLPLVGDLAPLQRRATSLAIVVSGMSFGMLIARVLSGVIANFTSWRNVYWFGFGIQWTVWVLLFLFMPDYPSKNPQGLNYFKMLWSIVKLLFLHPVLVQACIISFCIQAVFTSYWTTLSYLLSSAPYFYSSLIIGLFGLIGMAVMCLGPIYSRYIIDKLTPLLSTIMGLFIEIIGVIIGVSTGTFTVAGPIIMAILVDLGNQASNIALRSAIYQIDARSRNRVNTAYMVFAFCGQLTGTSAGNRLYALGGWTYSGGLSIAFVGFATIVAFAKGPKEEGWVGWSGGWPIRRDDLPPKKSVPPTESAIEEAAGIDVEAPGGESRIVSQEHSEDETKAEKEAES